MSKVTVSSQQRSTLDSERSELDGKASDPNRLATLAALTLNRQAPRLLLPAVLSAPTSFSLVLGDDKALALARSLVQLGIGSVAAWNKHGGNCSLFVRSSLNEWLKELGADTLRHNVNLDLAIVDEVDDLAAKEGNLFILVETEDGCGSLMVGKALEAMEREETGLGRAFYDVLVRGMSRWMYVYDLEVTRCFVERWKESIQMDMESDDGPLTEGSFADYCDAHEIAFPDIEHGIPRCIQGPPTMATGDLVHSLTFLRKHRCGPHAEWITPVLGIAAVRGEPRRSIEEALGLWDDGPCPNWLLSFYPQDPVSFAFDEEAQTMHEYSHPPTWIDTFDPANVVEVKSMLSHVRNIVRINVLIVQLSNALTRSFRHGSEDQHRLDHELRAA